MRTLPFVLCLLLVVACGSPDEKKLPREAPATSARAAAAVDPDVYVVAAGGRGSRPYRAQRFEGADWVEWELAFDATAAYDFSDQPYAVDQYDWNKLVGLKWDFFRSRENTLLVGWRYNLADERVELAPYLHQNGNRQMHDPVFFVAPEERFRVRIDWSEAGRAVYSFQKSGGQPVVESYAYRAPGNAPWQILHWFGGTQAAPHDITLRLYATRTSADAETTSPPGN